MWVALKSSYEYTHFMHTMRTATTLRQALFFDQGAVISLVGAGGKTSLMFRLAHELAAAGDTVLTTTTTKISQHEAACNASKTISGPVSTLLSRAEDYLAQQKHITAARDSYDGKLIGFKARDIDRLWQTGCFRWIIVEADGAARLPLKVPDAHEPVIPDCCHCTVGVIGLTAFEKPLSDQWVFRLKRFAQLTGLEPGAKITAAAITASLCHPEGIFKGFPGTSERIVFLNQADTPERLEAGRRIAAGLAEQYPPSGIRRVILGQLLFDPPVVEIYDF
ncbi:MAG: putative selenium-dependent hydroxylase accessory protein YqeC [Desulfobacterales bacterium]|nr:putative selenium-dependent hydroxylase accessory protein YqeC [Desulfobacterales bacterium]